MATKATANTFRVHLLDVGRKEYGDCVVCEVGKTRILIDGAHPGDDQPSGGAPSIPQQLAAILGGSPPFHLDLLVVTHCHVDHIGCLPAMVKDKVFQADWALVADEDLGWGALTGHGDTDALGLGGVPRAVGEAIAALREEPPSAADAAGLEQFIADAAGLRERYKAMIADLKKGKTRVVRYGRDKLLAFNRYFTPRGLTLLGPGLDHLELCRRQIEAAGRDAVESALLLAEGDAQAAGVEIYRALAAQTASDAGGGFDLGSAINCQSIVLEVALGKRKALLSGDMQLALPQVRGLEPVVAGLRQQIAKRGPYDFVKLGHHAARNAVDAKVLTEAGARRLGISTGILGIHHPNAGVLQLLAATPGIEWARTDRNGRIEVNLGAVKAGMKVARGQLNDAQPKPRPQDRPGAAPPPGLPSSGPGRVDPPSIRARQPEAAAPGTVEIVARIPNAATRVTLTIDIQPGGADAVRPPVSYQGEPQPGATLPARRDLRLLAGRERTPRLLFAYDPERLARNLSPEDVEQTVAALRAAAQESMAVPTGGKSPVEVAAEIHTRLRSSPYDGLVLLGGYDALPPFSVDVLNAELLAKVKRSEDPDDRFVVWSDDPYTDIDGDGSPEIPVSRIPDGRMADLFFTALAAPPPTLGRGRTGVRNFHRPFAESIASRLPGSKALLISEPAQARSIDPLFLEADAIYLMLHGASFDASRFWGARKDDHVDLIEAFAARNVRPCPGGVALAGCCWGALTVREIAARAVPGQDLTPRAPEASIALTFLHRGANAFVGCTGTHFSPLEPPFNYFGGPFHRLFWNQILSGVAPAAALFNTKREYGAAIPHPSPTEERPGARHAAIERKILAQFTCLGLGW